MRTTNTKSRLGSSAGGDTGFINIAQLQMAKVYLAPNNTAGSTLVGSGFATLVCIKKLVS